jgi:exo-poly-alpha-galacturonosidase
MNSIHSHDREGSRQKDRVLATLVAVSATCWICALAGSVAAGPPAPKNLIAPRETATETSLTLLWEPPSDEERGLSYEVYCDGARAGTTSKTFYTVAGLKPDATYSLAVRSKDAAGNLSSTASEVSLSTTKQGSLFNIVDYGAVGDGATKNTAAIQKAIDACTPGGTVCVPAGDFVSGALFLKSHMTLYIAKGGTLTGSADVDDYRPFIPNRYSGWEMETFASLINAGEIAHDGPYNVTNLAIRGEGTISGGGSALGNAMLTAEGYYSRARLICLMNCRDVNIQGLTLKNSPSWTLHYTYCKNVTCHGLTIVSEGIRNGDGIDPDSSADSYIFDCNISTSDDCIAIKSGKNPEGNRIAKPTENVLIAHCRFRGHGMSIGSEMSGGVRNVTVRDCEIAKDDLNGLQIKAPRERGGYVRNIRVLNCTLSQIKIITNIRYNTDYEPAPEIPFLGDMEFANLNMENAVTGKPAITIDGFEGAEKNTAGIHFRDIRMAAGSTISVKNCAGISFQNVLTHDGEKPNYAITNAESVDH